jgi:hypothetical protein
MFFAVFPVYKGGLFYAGKAQIVQKIDGRNISFGKFFRNVEANSLNSMQKNTVGFK